jgi:gephyrin
MEIKRAAILIISDEASEDSSLDRATSPVANCLLDLEIVVRNYANCGEFPLFLLSQDHLVLLSAATGSAAKDNTLEVSGPLGPLLANRLSGGANWGH